MQIICTSIISEFLLCLQTYSGSILISVNPYKELLHIYDEVGFLL